MEPLNKGHTQLSLVERVCLRLCVVCVCSGNIDSNTYEDTCREMFGVHAYVVFTVDRLMQNIVRQVLRVIRTL